MQTTPLAKARHSDGALAFAGVRFLTLLVGASLLTMVGCGPSDELTEAEAVAEQAGGLVSGNGISVNGISVNGISVNGISVNGISVNGLTPKALNTRAFAEWFKTDPEANAVTMEYLARCGLSKKQRLSYKDKRTKKKYVWPGLLGLTPGWAKGKRATRDEEQLITACLAAHANKYGLHIPISVLGNDAKGKRVDFTLGELWTFSRREACFFGDLFREEGIFVGADSDMLDPNESTARACGLTSSQDAVSSECPPFIHVGACADVCQLDKTGLYYERCTYNGKSYRPITTRLRPEDVYRCGDGVCQFTESCGTSNTWDSCRADCGTCQ